MLTFGDNLLLWRLHRSLSQERLAALADLPRPNLSDIEKGKRDVTLSTIRSLANALNISPGTLVNAEPPKPEHWKENLPRDAMERIARSVALGIQPEDPSEQNISILLNDVLHCNLQSVQGRKRHLSLPGRKSDRAWLLLRALYPAELLNSLLMRTLEHAELL
ncbi:MAG: helix-turn-helix domain-containing protein [Nitrospiraceae bacterium]|nr:MAG: helix-turn-helix domain-containing protein [Nitrospiraceae bacterium]